MSEANRIAGVEPAHGPDSRPAGHEGSPASADRPSGSRANSPGAARARYSVLSRRWLVIGAAVVMLLVPGFGLWYGLRDTGPKDDLGRLQGEWKITPAGAPGKDDGPPLLIRIEGDRWSHVVGDEVVTTWRLALDPDANPKRLDLTLIERNGRPVPAERSGPEPKLLGIYALDGDTLRWAQNPATAPDGRPKSLDDPEAMVLTLTRVKK